MRQIFIIIALAAIAGSSMAQQERAEQLFDMFINDDICKDCVKNNVNHRASEGDRMLLRNESYTFAIPTIWRYKLETLTNGLCDMQAAADTFFLRRADSNDNTQMRISVDRGNDILLGTYPDRNYLALHFHSADDSLRRYVYVVVWYDDTENDCIKGSLFNIYGLDASKKSSKLKALRNIFINGVEVDISNPDMLRQMGMNVINRETTVTTGGRTQQNSTITVIKDGQLIQSDDAHEATQNEVANQLDSISTMTVRPANSSEFIAAFKQLYSLFIAVQGDYMTTQKIQSNIITRMDGMVQDRGSLLTMKEERELCIKMLKSMKKDALDTCDSVDSVTSAHIDIVIKRLKKM